VEAFASRDADSFIEPREVAAVNEWMRSGKFGHIMRDHPWHGAVMLGGKTLCTTYAEFLEMIFLVEISIRPFLVFVFGFRQK
jgi:hypothetical protein